MDERLRWTNGYGIPPRGLLEYAEGRQPQADTVRDMEIHPADLAYRRRSLRIMLAIALLCGLGLWQLNGWLGEVLPRLAEGGDPDYTRRWLRGLLVGLALVPVVPLWLLGRSLRRLATAAQAEQRFPPREWRTLRDVRVLRGPTAASWISRVRGMASAATAMAVVCVLIALATYGFFAGAR